MNNSGTSYKGTVAVDGSDNSVLNINYTGLSYGVTYDVIVKPNSVRDIAGNKVSTNFTAQFTTEIDMTAPVVTSFTASSITTIGATLNVVTDENATCSYSTTDSAYSTMTPFSVTGGTAHTEVLTGLTPSTGYDYYVRCADITAQTNTMTTSANASFTTLTPDTTAPVITNIQTTAIGENVATITWNTDENATSQVEYGVTSAYGNFSAADGTADNTNHSVVLSSLTDGTDYHFRIISSDASSNTSTSGDNIFTTVEGADITKPVITLLGMNPLQLTVGDTYTDPGATALDNIDGDLTLGIVVAGDTVDTSTADIYNVTYDVSDSAGNGAVQETRTVIVVEPDATPIIPTISLNGIAIESAYTVTEATARFISGLQFDTTNAVSVTVNGSSVPAGAIVTAVSQADAITLGAHTYNVRVTSSTGDMTDITVTYQVNADPIVDETAPVITLLGVNPQTLTVGDTYTELGATASDDVDGDISSNIVINSSAVDMATAGTYEVTYNVTDAAGNVAVQETRTVVVEEAFDDTASLAVTGIDAVKTYATADDTFDNGWSWKFKVTVPTNETKFKMKFADFISGANSITSANNLRFYTAQSSDSFASTTATMITATNTYSDAITLNADLETGVAGRQIEVIVEMKVPAGSSGGSYSASYGINSEI